MGTIYDTRASRAWCQLSEPHFDAANRDGGNGTLMFIGGGCLDAPEAIPAGSVKGYGRTECYGAATWFARSDLELTAAELARREALADDLIAEILAEEAKS
jgi:hypothetical protein